MSAWPIPDEVVDEIARDMYDHDALMSWPLWSRAGGRRDRYLRRARDFLTRHRLVVIPDDADHERKWGLRYTDGSVSFRWDSEDDARWVLARAKPGQLEPVVVPIDYFRIPGQPITVGEEERDGE